MPVEKAPQQQRQQPAAITAEQLPELKKDLVSRRRKAGLLTGAAVGLVGGGLAGIGIAIAMPHDTSAQINENAHLFMSGATLTTVGATLAGIPAYGSVKSYLAKRKEYWAAKKAAGIPWHQRVKTK